MGKKKKKTCPLNNGRKFCSLCASLATALLFASPLPKKSSPLHFLSPQALESPRKKIAVDFCWKKVGKNTFGRPPGWVRFLDVFPWGSTPFCLFVLPFFWGEEEVRKLNLEETAMAFMFQGERISRGFQINQSTMITRNHQVPIQFLKSAYSPGIPGSHEVQISPMLKC